jgi:hypothetical protein
VINASDAASKAKIKVPFTLGQWSRGYAKEKAFIGPLKVTCTEENGTMTKYTAKVYILGEMETLMLACGNMGFDAARACQHGLAVGNLKENIWTTRNCTVCSQKNTVSKPFALLIPRGKR